MSRRWDALKPSSSTTATGSGSGRSNNNRRPPHHRPPPQASSRQAWRRSRDGNNNVSSDRDRPRLFPDRQHQPQSKNDDSIQISWNASLKTLQQQITGLKDGTISKEDTKHLIIKTLEDLRSISDKLMTEQQRSDSIRSLLDLLPISNDDIRNQLLDLVIQLLHAQSSLQMDGMDVSKYIKVLQLESRSNQGMICLTEFLRVAMDQLKPEDTATEVVGGVFLSLLEEHDNHQDDDMVPTILNTLSIFVQHSGHGSAILAPLTNVDAEGREQPVVNPLRQRLFRLLQAQLLHTSSQASSLADSGQQREDIRVSACECLTHVLRVTRKLDGVGGASSLMARRDVDMGILERFFLESLSGPSKLMVPSLSLLIALIQRYPESSSGVGAKLLSMPTTSHGTSVQEGNSTRSSRRCKVCSYVSGDLPSLLKLIHDKDLVSTHQGDDASSLSTLCVAEMLENMPFRKWFGTITTRSTTPRRSPAPVSGFGRRIIESLKCVISVSRCQFELGSYQPNNSNSSHHLSKLTITILNKLPYNDPTLLKEGTKLWASLALLVLELRLSDNKKSQFISTILVESCGGKVQPDGSLSTLCEPAKNFFTNKESSAPLIEHLSMNLSSGGPNGKASIQLLSALLRTRPQTAVEHWVHFSKGLNMLFNKQSYGIAIEVLEGLMLGRQDFGRLDEKAETTQRLAVVLDTALSGAQKESSARVKCLLLQTYGSLLSRDWDAFVSRGKDRFELHTDVILSHCIGDFNAKVRSTSCKALGNFCSSYVPTCENAEDICPVVSEHLQKALESTDHSVRCMALFGLGNLAMSISEREGDTYPLSTANILKMSRTILRYFDDPNDKVCGNALRSIGHVGSLLFGRITAPATGASDDDESKELGEHYNDVVDRLSGKLADSLASTSNERSTLTWKQRSAAKKHGWGACNSLGLLLRLPLLLDNGNRTISLHALFLVVESLKQNAFANEKAFLAALNTILSIDQLFLSEISRASNLLGRALCVVTLHLPILKSGDGLPRMSEKLQKEAFSLLGHVLESADVADVVFLLTAEGFDKEKLEDLYNWMVDRESSSRIFRLVSRALQEPPVTLDAVALEQAFASQALLQEKREQRPTTPDKVLPTEDDDEL